VAETVLYSVGTWDMERQAYTPQRGLSVPSFNITLAQLRQAVRELKRMGYGSYRLRGPDGSHDTNDPAVLIERTDGKCWKNIMREWKR
jgi:hypothetical protein